MALITLYWVCLESAAPIATVDTVPDGATVRPSDRGVAWDEQMSVEVYVIRSRENGRRYAGITKSIGERLRTHARQETRAGQMLGRFEVIHREEFADYAAARRREKFFKSGQGRQWLDERFGVHRSNRDG
jgi:putative endonuclease